MNQPVTNRRTLMNGALWSAPVMLASSTIPAYAASQSFTTPTLEYGLFVTVTHNGSRVGYQGAQESNPNVPATPQGYWEAVKAGNNPESDFQWSDASETKSGKWFSNGEGSFTPVTNSSSGSPAGYATTSGFWFSAPVPADQAQTGNGYLVGSTATLEKGAVFVTDVEIYVPSNASFLFQGNRQANTGIQIAGRKWDTSRRGDLKDLPNNGAQYLSQAAVASTWTAEAPSITINPDGSGTLTGRIITTTTKNLELAYDGRNNRWYAQTTIMPATLTISNAYSTPQSNFKLTSFVQSGNLYYTAPAPYNTPATHTLPLNNALTTTAFVKGW